MHRLMMVIPAVWLAGCAVDDAADDVLVHVGDDETDTAGPIGYWAYEPMGFARINSSGGIVTQFDSVSTPADAGVTATRVSPGVYTVAFVNLGSPAPWPWIGPGAGGNVQLTSEGQGAARCRLDGWGGTPNMTVRVRCHLPSGAAADSGFAVLVQRQNHPTTPGWGYGAYSYVQPDGTVDPTYDFNSTGTHNTVIRYGVGIYTVTTPGLNDVNHGLLVTSYGGSDPGATCSISTWYAGGAVVKCYDPSGAPRDSAFSFTRNYSGPALGQQGAHGWFNSTNLDPSYTGMTRRSCGAASIAGWSGALVTIDLTGEFASWDASPYVSASFATSYSWDPAPAGYCKIEGLATWGVVPSTTTRTEIRCYSTDGAPLANPKTTFVNVGSDAWGPC